MASPSAVYAALARQQSRCLYQLPRIGRVLPPVRSRASCFWSQSTSQSLRTRSSDCIRAGSIWNKTLTTSTARFAGPGDGNEKTPGKLDGEKQKAPLTTILKQTLTLPTRQPHEQIYNIPNLLTFSRLLSTPLLGYLILHNHPLYALTLFIYAGTSDLLDGWIARKWNLQTVVGSVVDPMADKALMTTLVTCLAINGSLSVPLATLILGRDVSLALAALYFRYASLPAPKTMARYWDFSLPSAEVHPTTVSKLNTFLQLILIGTTMCVSLMHAPAALEVAADWVSAPLIKVQEGFGGPAGVQRLVQGMSAVVAGTTVYSGLSYAWMKDAVKILGEDEALKRKQGFRGRMIIGSTFGSVIVVAAVLWWREMEMRDEVEREG